MSAHLTMASWFTTSGPCRSLRMAAASIKISSGSGGVMGNRGSAQSAASFAISMVAHTYRAARSSSGLYAFDSASPSGTPPTMDIASSFAAMSWPMSENPHRSHTYASSISTDAASNANRGAPFRSSVEDSSMPSNTHAFITVVNGRVAMRRISHRISGVTFSFVFVRLRSIATSKWMHMASSGSTANRLIAVRVTSSRSSCRAAIYLRRPLGPRRTSSSLSSDELVSSASASHICGWLNRKGWTRMTVSTNSNSLANPARSHM
jgi:hypothetical protein